MKTIATSKGEFVVRQTNGLLVTKNSVKMFDFQTNIHVINGVKYEYICKLSEATEEDASKLVEQYQHCISKHKNYLYKAGDILYFNNPIESIHSLLKSKGIDINNGNWYLFKKI